MGRGHFMAPFADPPDRYRMNVPLGTSFKAETLKIVLKDHVMTIKAKLDQEAEDGVTHVRQKFVKKFTLPSNVDTMEVKSVLTPQGYLKVDAPLLHHTFPLWMHHHHDPFKDVDLADDEELEEEIPIHLDDNNNVARDN